MNGSNIRIRTNVIRCERTSDPVKFRKFLTWSELVLYADTFYTTQGREVLQRITSEQAAEQKFMSLASLKLPNPFHAIYTARDHALPPVSQPAFYENDSRQAKPIRTPLEAIQPVLIRDRPDNRSPQQKVIEAPLMSKTVVLAPPGTGKTYAVIQRLLMLSRGELSGALDRVLLVSFSRTAVGEMRRRLEIELAKSASSAYTRPRIQTLDSFAGTILAQAVPDMIREEGNYDASIRALTAILEGQSGEVKCNETAALISQRVQCVIVDEVQDIVGDRARLVAALLGALNKNGPHGVMMLGDLRQAIFTFQLQKLQRPYSEHDAFWLVKRVRELYPDRLDLSFDESFRYQTPDSREFAKRLRDAMDDPTGTRMPGERPNANLLGRVLSTVAELNDPAELLSQEFSDKRIAVLARQTKKAEQLWAACRERLKNYGVKVRLHRAANEGRAPAWVARLFNGSDALVCATHKAFSERYRTQVLNDESVATESWDWLVEGLRLRDGFNRDDVVDKLSARPNALSDPPESDSPAIHVSTIHLAKGREFDVVVVADLARLPDEDQHEESRVAYVAATRAKRQLFRCSGNRWLERVFEWKDEMAEDFDVSASADAGRMGSVDKWHRGQDVLWRNAGATNKTAILSYSNAESRFVLTFNDLPADLRAPVVFSNAFGKRFSAYANSTLHAQPCGPEFVCEILEMNTHCNQQCPGGLMLLPQLSGIIRRR